MNLANIGPATRTVVLGRAAVEVSGLSLRKLVQLISAYPQVVSFVAGGKIDLTRVLADGPDMALAIFSLGAVGPARKRLFWQRPLLDEDMLASFDSATAGCQIGALAAIFDLTFKGGERALPFLSAFAAPPAATPVDPPAETPSESWHPQSSD